MPLNHLGHIKYVSRCNKCHHQQFLAHPCLEQHRLEHAEVLKQRFIENKMYIEQKYDPAQNVECDHINCKICICGGNKIFCSLEQYEKDLIGT